MYNLYFVVKYNLNIRINREGVGCLLRKRRRYVSFKTVFTKHYYYYGASERDFAHSLLAIAFSRRKKTILNDDRWLYRWEFVVYRVFIAIRYVRYSRFINSTESKKTMFITALL